MRRTLGLALTVAAAALVAGCENMEGGLGGPAGVAPPPSPPPAPAPAYPSTAYDPGEFAWSAAPGGGGVLGRVQYRAVSGAQWTCTGQTVALIPRTRYSAGRMRALYESDEHAIVPVGVVKARDAARPGVDYGRYVRTAACDSRNAFVFDHLPDGSFFIIARAVPHSHPVGANEGVVLMQRIELRNGGTLRISLPVER